ncbi:MAG: hypothetical protein DI539_26440 [Flavobacterium psychrophilum]|nr:MAG: hypothetical protein DI539_26440 [Flavobacterium psychrophilum]
MCSRQRKDCIDATVVSGAFGQLYLEGTIKQDFRNLQNLQFGETLISQQEIHNLIMLVFLNQMY